MAFSRVVVTGFGVLSPLGNDEATIVRALRNGTSGVAVNPEYVERGLRCQLSANVDYTPEDHISRRELRFMGRPNALAWQAAHDAIAMAGLEAHEVQSERTALIVGTGGAGVRDNYNVLTVARAQGVGRILPYYVVRIMTNSVPATLSTSLKTRGPSYSMGSACATSLHTIGHGAELIQLDKADVVVAGGAEEEFWSASVLFDSMKALSSSYNDTPTTASRPFDATRDGFVPSEGAGIVILERREHALARGAHIIAELTGYGASSDGADPVAPSGRGSQACMRLALAQCGHRPIHYLNAHGTSTPAGDMTEIDAVRAVFGDDAPPLSSTKALMGHALGGAGAIESIFCLIMMRNKFMTPCYNLVNLDPGAAGYPLVREVEDTVLENVMTNSFGFGGTNATIVFSAPD